MAAIDRSRRNQLARIATDIRLRALPEGTTPQVVADRICQELPDLFRLEAQRLARGWSRSEVSARLDGLYQADGLAPPHITAAELCRWEHGQRRPSDERMDYLCRLYETRPDRLGYGVDYSAVDVGHLARSGVSNLWPGTSPESLNDLLARVRDARDEITVFGLTRNFYARDQILPLFEAQAVRIPVTFYVIDPRCPSREDRYRLEPIEAAMEDPDRYTREILRPLHLAANRVKPAAAPHAGMRIFLYNFPCSFAMERIDRSVRVMLYGHGKRGTEGPILVFNDGTPFWDYFLDQLSWLHRLATEPREPWTSKGVVVRPLTEDDLAVGSANR